MIRKYYEAYFGERGNSLSKELPDEVNYPIGDNWDKIVNRANQFASQYTENETEQTKVYGIYKVAAEFGYHLASPVAASPRFELPTDKQVVGIAILFNDGRIDHSKLADMVGMCQFVIDRLYENGNIIIPSSKEKNNGTIS